ncbi:MAG: hypothetical protein COS84_09990 [Armatimonadetes bacterium CG07_land_8_20_14_0_80_40_9]|nr:MAG: hypothetical protein COS84_09990 [Armatimonadetes bacterium CG07_land_8_20_14_0_80_40_9]
MNNVRAKNWEEVEKYREKIFKSKEECRKAFAKLPFEKKIKIVMKLQKRAKFLKSFKSAED